jgi:hypothetical protein
MVSICLENFLPPFDIKSVFIFFQWHESLVSNKLLCLVFLTQFALLCLLIGALRPFTFSFNVESACCFQSFLFHCCLVLPLLCLLVCLF